jgi:hypothetical protein
VHRFHRERFNLKKFNETGSKEQCCFEMSNRFAALENIGTDLEQTKYQWLQHSYEINWDNVNS